MEEHSNKSINWTVVLIIAVMGMSLIGYKYTEAIKEKNAIERERIESSERLKSAELRQEREAAEQKQEQQDKEFVAKRKDDCLTIYKTEGVKWNNVNGWRYDHENDKCYIQYKDKAPKTKAECDDLYPTRDTDGKPIFYNLHDNIVCKDGNFENGF